MIVVCEPQCTGSSHEKVNSGFLTLVRRAFPDDAIRLYADPTHHRGLDDILAHDGIELDRVERRDFAVRDANTARGALATYRQLALMFREAAEAECDRVLFLSASPLMLHMIKRLRANYSRMKLAFVLHADFEDIAHTELHEVPVSAVREPTLVEKLRSIRVGELPSKAVGLVQRKLAARYTQVWRARFRTREQMLWRHDDGIAYIALSPHVVTNAARYLDVDALHVREVDMPINFAPIRSAPANPHLKLATFGYGDPAALRRVVDELDRLHPTRPYELRIIGMDNRGLENHPRVHCPSPGKPLSRADMERHASDIDAFLILYDQARYRLSCSGAIFEAFSYVKPVLHIGNPCIVQFDPASAPIGFSAPDLEALAHTIAAMIDDFSGHRAAFDERRRNIIALRERLGEGAVAKLRAAFAC